MTASSVLSIAFGFIAVWLVGVVGFAFAKAAQPAFDPLPPELPEHHGDDHDGHAAHGHGHDHGAHGQGAHDHGAHGHGAHGQR